MRKLLLLGAAIAALHTPARATPLGLFDGPLKIMTASSSCSYFAGNIFTAMYQPPNIGSNGSGSRLTILMGTRDEQAGSMRLYALATGSFVTSDGSAVTVDQNSMGVGSAASGTAKITITQQVPKVPTATAVTIKLVGSIEGFNGDASCTAGFDATMLSYRLP